MSDDDMVEGLDFALINRFSKRNSMSRHGRSRREEKTAMRRTPAAGSGRRDRSEQMNLRVRPEWKQHLADLARRDRYSMIEILEIGVELYERNREAQR